MSSDRFPDRSPLGGPSDDALVERARHGDRDALELLLHRHADRIHAVCRRIVNDPHDALDATQEAMIAVVRGIRHFDGTARFTTWCYRVATNAALDELRRARRRPRPLDDPPNPGDARDATGGVDARIHIDAALATLPSEFRVAVVLRDLCDLDYAEIAAVLDIPPGTVRSRIARGRAALRAALREPTPSADRPNERR